MRIGVWLANWQGTLAYVSAIFMAISSIPSARAQVDALLPYKEAVTPTSQMPIDGIYKISSTGTRIRIEKGRGYALDEWVQLIFRIRTNMVTMQNIVRKEAGHYTGYDLPLLSDAKLTLQADGSLKVDVGTLTGPASFNLTPLAVDDPNGFNTERVAAGHKGPRLKIPPVSMQQPLALGDPMRQQGAAQKAKQSGKSDGSIGFFDVGKGKAQPAKRQVISARCSAVAGKDPDTGLEICDYPLPELK